MINAKMDTTGTSVQVRTFINKFYTSELSLPYFQFSECNCDTDGTAKCDATDSIPKYDFTFLKSRANLVYFFVKYVS